MKIIKLKHSILFLKINPEADTVKCWFLFFISLNTFSTDSRTFDLNVLSLAQVKEFYKTLANDWKRKYRL